MIVILSKSSLEILTLEEPCSLKDLHRQWICTHIRSGEIVARVMLQNTGSNAIISIVRNYHNWRTSENHNCETVSHQDSYNARMLSYCLPPRSEMCMTDLWTMLNHNSLSWDRVPFNPSRRGAYGFVAEVLPSQASKFRLSTTTLSCRLWPFGTKVLGELPMFHRCLQKKRNADTTLDMRTKISGKKGITRRVSRARSCQHLEHFASWKCASHNIWAQSINLQCGSFSQGSNIWMITGPLVSWCSTWISGRCEAIWNGSTILAECVPTVKTISS